MVPLRMVKKAAISTPQNHHTSEPFRLDTKYDYGFYPVRSHTLGISGSDIALYSNSWSSISAIDTVIDVVTASASVRSMSSL